MALMALKKQQIEYIAISILVLLALLVGITRFKKKDKKDEVFSGKRFNQKWKEVEILERELPQAEKGIAFSITSERSPFKSPFDFIDKIEFVEKEIVLPVMDFQGMIWNSIRPQAIIDNKVYDIDDAIKIKSENGKVTAEVKIKNITKKGIYLEYKRKEFIVRPKIKDSKI